MKMVPEKCVASQRRRKPTPMTDVDQYESGDESYLPYDTVIQLPQPPQVPTVDPPIIMQESIPEGTQSLTPDQDCFNTPLP